MLGSAKTNIPLLTLTSWVKGTSSFVLRNIWTAPKWRHPKYTIDIWQIDGLPWVRDNYVSKNFEEIVSLVKFLNNIRWKICSQRRFLEFLQNSSEFVVATVLRNPIGNLISLAEFHIFVEFPPKTILESSIMYKILWKRDRLYWILGTALKIEPVIHTVIYGHALINSGLMKI